METPQRKRRRSETPSSPSSSRYVNKRFCTNILASPSPKIVRFDPAGDEKDTVLESDVLESPVAQGKGIAPVTVSFAPNTPIGKINDPFTRLSLKTPAQKKGLSTPVATKGNSEGAKSVKKSARKTPGSAKSRKVLPFRIKTSSTSSLDHPLTVLPIAAIPRKCFPICWLAGPTPRVFSINRQDILPPLSGQEMVMVAKVEGEKCMVVIERVSDNVHAMCTLKKDLKIKDVRLMAKAGKEIAQPSGAVTEHEAMQIDGGEWWRGMKVKNWYNGEKNQISLRFLIEDVVPTESTKKATVNVDMPVFTRHNSEFSNDSGYISSSPIHDMHKTSSIRLQYLEALYSTKTSLAYFAKSSLSRARSEFQRAEPSDEGTLVSLLQNLILNDDDFTSKYENHLFNFVKDDVQSSHMYITNDEREYLIRKFRRNCAEAPESNESTLQQEINSLKIRETQLQIIIIAELLALHDESGDIHYLDESNREEYEMLIISHLDRLSISGLLESDNDFSEQFKREILLPFYGSRLPRIVDVVGGPMDFTSPIKQIKKPHPRSISRQPILSPNTLDRIARPRRQELSPTPFPIITSRKTFKSTPKKHNVNKSAGVLKRLQKTEVNMRRTVPSKKLRKTGLANGRTASMTWGSQKIVQPVTNLDDSAQIQVPETPAPKKRYTF